MVSWSTPWQAKCLVVAAVCGAVALSAGCGGGGGGSTSQAPASSAPAQSAPAETQAGGGNADQGKQVFASNGCGSCHTLDAAGSSGTVGPNLDEALVDSAKQAGKPLAEFTRQSIVDPNAFVAKGFQPGVMPQGFGQKLSKQQLDDLVAFITQSVK